MTTSLGLPIRAVVSRAAMSVAAAHAPTIAALKAHLLDIGIIVATTPAFGSFLSSLRLARLARLLRVLRLGMLVGRALQIERRLSSVAVFRFVALATAFVVVVAGAAESLVDKSDFHSTWDGVWFAVATVTTVGYGDLQARSVEGRIVAILVMLFGIGFLSVLTATIASRFVKTDTGSEEIVATLSRPS